MGKGPRQQALGGSQGGSSTKVQLRAEGGGKPSFVAQIDGFIASLMEGSPAQPDGREARRTVAACTAAAESAASGQPVRPAVF